MLYSINSILGDNSEDIKNVYLLSDENNKIEAIYIVYNSGNVDRFNYQLDDDYSLFIRDIQNFLKKIGATKDNKNSRWFVTERENRLGINYDKLDDRYGLSLKKKIQAKEDEDLIGFLNAIKENNVKSEIKNEENGEVTQFLENVRKDTYEAGEQEIIEVPFEKSLEKKEKRYSIKEVNFLTDELNNNTRASNISSFSTGVAAMAVIVSIISQKPVLVSVASLVTTANVMCTLYFNHERKMINDIIDKIIEHNIKVKEKEGGII